MNKVLLFLFLTVFCFTKSLLAVVPTISVQTNSGTLNFCTANTLALSVVNTTNGGTMPMYQWYKNGVAITGATLSTFTSIGNLISVNDQFYCELTSNDPTASPTVVNSNVIALNVTLVVTPTIAITSIPVSGVACAGQLVTFVAPISYGGTTPVRQWKKNGVNVGTNSSNYSSTSFANGDVISCVLTSNQACISSTISTSNNKTLTINPSVQPNVSIASSNAAGCIAAPVVNFTATSTNGGTTPAYSWFVNGTAAGVTGASFNSTTLVNGDLVTCNLTSNAFCAVPNKDTSNAVTVTIFNPVTPTVSISVDLNPTCGSNTSNFTALFTNGGNNPHFQWKVNGASTGGDTSYFSANFFNNGDIVTCTLTSDALCATATNVVSNNITMSITPPVTPTIFISASPGNTICAGQTVTYTATITNGGTSPIYIWKINGVVIPGNNANTFSSNSIPNGSLISVILTSNSPCVTAFNASSNNLPLTVKPLLTPTIAISGNKTNICSGASVNFSSSTTISGAAPTFQWKVNGVNVGTSTASFNTTALPVGINTITCTMGSSSNQCLTSASVTSNQFIVTVNPLLTPVVTITASANNVCYNTPISFTASVVNGGLTPTYKWKINGVTIAVVASSFNINILNNGDIVTCIVTSTETCVTQQIDTSNAILMQIKPLVTPQIVTNRDTDYVCQNDQIIFSRVSFVNGGASPIFQWYKNGVATGNSTATYSSTSFVNGDVVYCQMNSNADCATPPVVTGTKDTIHIYAPAVPIVTIASSDTVTCIGTNIIFTTTVTDAGSVPFYQWYWNGLPHGTNNNAYSTTLLETNDSVFVVMNSNAPCLTKPNDTSNAIKMTVFDNVTPTINIVQSVGAGAVGTPIVYTATTSVLPNYNIQWYRNGALITISNNVNTWSTTIANTYDSVYAKVINFTGCYLGTSATSNRVRLGALGIGNFAPANFVVYPNPVQNIATIEGVAYGDELILYDITGKIITKKTIATMGTYQLDMTGYANGLYQAKFIRGTENWVVRLVKN